MKATQVQEALLDAALGYAIRGLRVLPVDPTITDPGIKRPLITEWQTYATNDPVQMNRWWDRWPDAAIGIVTDGLVVLDVDAHGDDGHASLQALIEEFGPLPDTLRAMTPRNGVHYYFHFAGEACKVLGFRPGLDLIVSGVKKNFVVAPPSVFPYGSYVWQGPDTVTMAPVPEWLMDVAAQAPQAAPSSSPGQKKDGRHNGLISVARRLRHGGAGFDEIIAALEAENDKDPLPAERLDEIEQIATWVSQLPTFVEELARVKQTYSTPRSSRISDLTDHKVMWAYIEAAEKAGRLDDLGVSARRLSDSAAVARKTIQHSLERLSEVIVPMAGFARGRARRYRLVLPPEDGEESQAPVRTLSEAREWFLRLAFGRRQNALRIAQALWAPVGDSMTRTAKELGAALGIPTATVRGNLKHPAFIRVDRTHWRLAELWQVALNPDTDPETWFTLTALFAENTGTLAAWNANKERADDEITQYDQSFRDRYGFDRLTGEILR